MVTVSVAMATYNGEKHLRRQLDSLAAQSYSPAELVVVDDGSDDETLSIVTTFAKDSPFPVRIHRNENRLGYRGNFLRAANLCRSDLIAFCDQDDNWYPQKIAACVEQFSDPDVLLVYHNANVVTDDGTQIGSLDIYASTQRIILPMTSAPLSQAAGFTQVFRGWMLHLSHLWPMSLDHHKPRELMAHDQWIYFLAAALGKIGYLDEPLVAYVQHGQNTSGWGWGWSHSPHVPRTIKSVLTNYGENYSQLSMILAHRAAILDSAQGELDGIWKKRAQIAANNYLRLSQAYAKRSTIYTSAKFADRLKVFRELLVEGSYQGRWSLSRKSLIKDICLGVPIAPYLTLPSSVFS